MRDSIQAAGTATVGGQPPRALSGADQARRFFPGGDDHGGRLRPGNSRPAGLAADGAHGIWDHADCGGYVGPQSLFRTRYRCLDAPYGVAAAAFRTAEPSRSVLVCIVPAWIRHAVSCPGHERARHIVGHCHIRLISLRLHAAETAQRRWPHLSARFRAPCRR